MISLPRRTIFLGILFLSTLLGVWIFHTWPENILQQAGATHPTFGGINIPLQEDERYQERLAKEILVARYNPSQFLLYIARSQKYFSFFEKELKNAGIPDDFKYLAVAESALRPDVASSAGAGGIWQLMPDTARQFGLRVDDLIDERLHVEKSTHAAIAYFQDLALRFKNDWPLVAAAYNRGHNGLARDIAAQPGSRGYWDLYLNPETAQYVYRIVAIKYLFQSQRKFFDIEDVADISTGRIQKITATGPIEDLSLWAAEKHISYAELREKNPWILSKKLPEESWEIALSH